MIKITQFKIDDRVCYSASFLKSTCAEKDIADLKGNVKSVTIIHKDIQLVVVQWDNENTPRRILNSNLSRIRSDGLILDI